MSRLISQDDMNQVKEFTADNPAAIVEASRRVVELAVEAGIKVNPENPDVWDSGFVVGFVMGALARGIQENDGEIEEFQSDDVNDDRWGF